MSTPAGEMLYFMGISFRSTSHMYWFQGSMTFALLSLASLVWCLRAQPARETLRLVLIYWSLVLLFHVGASVSASWVAYQKAIVLGQDPNGPLFSTDCIWFNAMMSAGYVTMIVWLRRLARRWRGGATPTHDAVG